LRAPDLWDGQHDPAAGQATRDGRRTGMKITHLVHACLLVETGGARMLLDPGTMSEGFAELRDLDAVLITHDHDDHFDKAKISALMDANPRALLIVEQVAADAAPDSVDRGRIQVVSAGDTFKIAGISIMAVGGTHAVIHPDIERTTNVGFYFNDSGLLHPGDDLTPPAVDVRLLALPVSGPWLSLAATVDYLRAINPPATFPMHEAALTYTDFWYDTIGTLKPKSTKFQILEPGIATEL
jgi:L-ascorbate metabolism protein UlaG (beta-lactamase superfamily)